MNDLSGQDIGRYHILEPIGAGGMATVYRARDTRLERDVAVKVIRRDALPPQHLERILKRFEREARVVASLSHPNIVKVLDYGDVENTPYLVLEYQPAGTLKSKISGPIAWQEALALLTPIARALEHAHRAHIVHRDVKPSNILIASDGRPMLTDFGIAKLLESEGNGTLNTGTGVGIGTPEYMAPEQGLGKDADARADIYSLGVVFYEMITGRRPFKADTPMAVMVKQINEPLPRPSDSVPDLPDFVERFVMKALAKRPQDRFRDMGQMVQAMERMPQQKGGLAKHIASRADRSRSAPAGKATADVARSEAATTLFEQAPRRGRAGIIASAVAGVALIVAAVVLGPRMLAASSASAAHTPMPAAGMTAAQIAPPAASTSAVSATPLPSAAPTATQPAAQTPASVAPAAAGPTTTPFPGNVLMTYGASASGMTHGGYAFYAAKGDIVAISVFPETQEGKTIYSNLTLKNSSGETLVLGSDINLSYTMLTKQRGFLTAGSQINRYVIPNDGIYYIDAGLSARGYTQGAFVIVLKKLDK